MQLLSIAVFAAAISGIAAKQHWKAICVNDCGKSAHCHNPDASRKACGNYFMRSTGGKVYDKCPDCAWVGGDDGYCQSNGWHIGGDEWVYYCQYNGAWSGATY